MLEVEDPATGRVLARVPDASVADCLAALDAVADAAAGWREAAPRTRAAVLRRAAHGLRRDDDMAVLVTLESGKPLREARDEVAFAADYLEWYADEATRIGGRLETDPSGGCSFAITRRPVGPCLVVTPWNFPLAIPARGVAPALAAGCTVVLRASDRAPLSALALARALSRAGLPAGCVEVVTSSRPDATDPLLDDRRLRKLTFTGSAAVGAHLIGRSAPRALRVTAELGGNAPFIVTDDADLELAVAAAVEAKCRNGGQACTAANRFLVQERVSERFTILLAKRMAALRVGPGSDEAVDVGPMISAQAVDRLTALVEDAVSRGARVVLPGGAGGGPGHFFSPMVLREVPEEARLVREEIFGPIAAVATYADDAEAIGRANDCEQGLAAYVMSGDPRRSARIADALEVGMVAVNRGRVSCAAAPFGGVKGSGFGRSGGREGIDEYLDTVYRTSSES
jgi:succinate-semialdehyde dehydrogenase/glutarate-semialdehyde dehydrogenase